MPSLPQNHFVTTDDDAPEALDRVRKTMPQAYSNGSEWQENRLKMNPFKAAQKLLVAGDAPRSVDKRTAVDRLNVILGIVTVSMFAALVIAAVSEALEPTPAPYRLEVIV